MPLVNAAVVGCQQHPNHMMLWSEANAAPCLNPTWAEHRGHRRTDRQTDRQTDGRILGTGLHEIPTSPCMPTSCRITRPCSALPHRAAAGWSRRTPFFLRSPPAPCLLCTRRRLIAFKSNTAFLSASLLPEIKMWQGLLFYFFLSVVFEQ